MKSALIVWGGWDGHEPDQVADFFAELLKVEGFDVTVSDTLSSFDNSDELNALDVIVPVWTMGEISYEQCANVRKAVSEHGVGLAGCHGGMCDAFRGSTEWQYMTGGQWVAHPGDDGVEYTVKITDRDHEITRGLSDFVVKSEQYYLLTDPANNVLATCSFPNPTVNDTLVMPCEMPTVWTRQYGKGRVSYNALGHKRSVLEEATAKELCRRGLLWASKTR